jgi:uncharacterized phage protein (TIGR01671 family)
MRDIIFRGKRLDNGEWMYGDLQIGDDDHIPMIGTVGPGRWVEYIQVDPSTIGQYTGLRDRAVEMIWEGDILSDGAFTYEVRYKGTGFVTILDGHVYTMDTRPTKIVIGNIHDNPELLK